MRPFIDSDNLLARSAVDVLLDYYVCWREECQAVWLTYQSWAAADRRERRLAYAGYLSALDREERSSRAYADQIAWVTRICN
jgi:hypothetical protein